MKHLYSLLAALLCAAVSLSAQEFTVGVLNYKVLPDDEKTVAVIGYNDPLPEQLDIPSIVTYEGTDYTVTVLERNSLTSVGCTSITLPPTLKTMCRGCIAQTNITSVTIPASVTTIEPYVIFRSPVGNVIFEDSEEPLTLYPYNFFALSSKYSMYMGRNINIVDQSGNPADLFMDQTPFVDSNSIKELVIGPEVTSLEPYYFMYAGELTSVTIQPGKLKTLPREVFRNCAELVKLSLPETLEAIDVQTFMSCTKLDSINIPNSVTDLGVGAFSGCNSLRVALLPLDIEEIKSGVFSKCALTSVYIPSEVTSIGYNAFGGCPLAEVRCAPIVPPTTSSSFSDYSATLYVREGSEEAYSKANEWKKFTNIIASDAATGVDDIVADGGRVKVYNLNGVCVMEGDASAVSTLEAGLYIVENKAGECTKVVIR